MLAAWLLASVLESVACQQYWLPTQDHHVYHSWQEAMLVDAACCTRATVWVAVFSAARHCTRMLSVVVSTHDEWIMLYSGGLNGGSCCHK
jgi:hypothetical protein